MIIIGEKINGAIPSASKAIEERDEAFIADLVDRQVAAGADYLDVCAGTAPEVEEETLLWLIGIVESRTDTPICIDSPDPELLARLIPKIARPGLINSVSGEGDKVGILYPVLRDNPEWKTIVLTCNDDGIPPESEKKVAIALDLIAKAEEYGIGQDRIFIDPLVLSLAAVNDALVEFMKAVRAVHEAYPGVHFTSGLSNISYGMPLRKLVNRNFLALAMSAGMDSAIMDPTDKTMVETVYAVEALLGRDRLCRKYSTAYRKGVIGS